MKPFICTAVLIIYMASSHSSVPIQIAFALDRSQTRLDRSHAVCSLHSSVHILV